MVPSQKEKKLNTYLKTKIFTIKMKSLTHLLLHALPPKPFYFLILTKNVLLFTVGILSLGPSLLLLCFVLFLNNGKALFISCSG